MPSAYPTGLDSFATSRTDITLNLTTQAADHNNYADAINKIEAELGINPSGASATVVARLDALSSASVELDITAAPWSVPTNGTSDGSAAWQSAIDTLSAADGGTFVVPDGTYRIRNVDVKDNVWIKNMPGVVYKFPSTGGANFDRLFFIGQTAVRRNIRFFGRCDFDRAGAPALTGLTGMTCLGLSDFLIEGIRTLDWTDGNAINLAARSGGAAADHSAYGIVRHIEELRRTNAGYGAIQVQGARHVLLENIRSQGGYAVNCELDAWTTGDDTVEDLDIHNVYAERYGGSGNSVVKFISHHGHPLRRIRVRGATSYDSPANGLYFATLWSEETTHTPIMSDITIEDYDIVGPDGNGVMRETGGGEMDDIHGLVMRNVKVRDGGAHGFSLGMSATLEDCSAENCVSDGIASNFMPGNFPMPFTLNLRNFLSRNNGSDGLELFGNIAVVYATDCRFEHNAAKAVKTGSYNWIRLDGSSVQHGADAASGLSGQVYHSRDSTKVPIVMGPWSQNNSAASQTNVVLSSVRNQTLRMERAGSIVGITVRVRKYADARTAGTLTVEALKNAAALTTPFTAVLNGTNTRGHAGQQATGVAGATFVAGDTIGIRITTDASWAPTTADIDVWLIVVED